MKKYIRLNLYKIRMFAVKSHWQKTELKIWDKIFFDSKTWFVTKEFTIHYLWELVQINKKEKTVVVRFISYD